MDDPALLVCTATEFESTLLRDQLAGDRRVRIVRMGIGLVNAAHSVTVAIAQHRPTAIIVCGIGGAYPSSGLAIGDVVAADREIYGDLGAQSPAGFLDMEALGLAVIDTSSGTLFNELPMQLFPAPRRVSFVTVSTCTGTSAGGLGLEARTGGAVENMEGAAVAHVAHLHGIPVGEVRGISNIATDRDKSTWRIRDAAEAAQRELLAWMAKEPR
jgi:futalosine hydrolase